MNNTGTKKCKSRLLGWFWTLFVVVASLALGGIFLCRYTPGAYNPLSVPHPEEVSPYLTHTLGPDFVNQVQLDTPFELLVEQDGLNDIIRRQSWIEEFDSFKYTDPVILFDHKTIYLMGTLEYKELSSVLTIVAFPQMDSEGKVSLNIGSIRLGILPVTRLVSFLAKKAFKESRSCFEEDPQLEKIVRAIIHNESFEPVFKISSYPVRITLAAIEPKRLTLQFEPQ